METKKYVDREELKGLVEMPVRKYATKEPEPKKIFKFIKKYPEQIDQITVYSPVQEGGLCGMEVNVIKFYFYSNHHLIKLDKVTSRDYPRWYMTDMELFALIKYYVDNAIYIEITVKGF